LSKRVIRPKLIACLDVPAQRPSAAASHVVEDTSLLGPMSEATRQRLSLLAEQASDAGRKVSPMQIAAQILEDALGGMQEQ
jgi:hypothetical protein